MGGYGSGGHNRTHDYTGRYKRLDSFHYGECFPLLNQLKKESLSSSVRWTDGGEIGIDLHSEYLGVRYKAGNEEVRENLYFEAIPNTYGGADRYYFLCPRCGKRSRYLYLHKQYLKCRKCAGLNYRSQQATKNDKLAAYRLIKFIYEKFRVTESLSPHEAMRYHPERPKGMHAATYYRLTMELHTLKMEYHNEFMKSASGIFGGLENLNARLEKYRD